MARKKKNNGLPYVGKYRGKLAVYWYDEHGAQRRKVCSAQEEAEEICRQKEKEVRGNLAFAETNLRAIHTTLEAGQVRDAETAFAMLQKNGWGESSLVEVTAYFLDNYTDPQESPTVESFVFDLLERKERAARAEKTLSQLKTNLTHFADYCSKKKIERIHQITTETVEKYLDGLMVRPSYGPRNDEDGTPRLIPAGSTTKANRLRNINTLLSAAVKRRYIKYNPCDSIERIDTELKPKAFLTIDEVFKLLDLAKKEGCFGHYYFRLATMFRDAEMERFWKLPDPWKFINLKTGIIHLPASCCKTRADKKRGGRRINISKQPNFKTVLKNHKGQNLAKSRTKEEMIFDALGKRPEERHNIIRDTAISLHASYRGSLTDITEEAGNTERIIKNHYLVPFTEEEANRFFNWKDI